MDRSARSYRTCRHGWRGRRGHLVAELPGIQVGVHTLGLEQLFVRALLDDLPVLDHQDLIGMHDSGQPVRDHERGAAFRNAFKLVLDYALGARIQR